MKRLEDIFKYPFGACSYANFSDKLLNCRKASLIPNNAKSVIVTLFPYKVEEASPVNICRYSSVADYHDICGKMLDLYVKELKNRFKDNEFVPFIDNSPIPEVAAASMAGLGVVGENGLLINDTYGSFVFIGEIVTDLPLEYSESLLNKGCLRCNKCKAVCPVQLNKSECISAVSQKKGKLDEKEQNLLKNVGLVWGCDICANICPMNKNAKLTDIKEFKESYRNTYRLNEDIKNRAYSWRGEAVIKRNYDILNK